MGLNTFDRRTIWGETLMIFHSKAELKNQNSRIDFFVVSNRTDMIQLTFFFSVLGYILKPSDIRYSTRFS